MSLSDVWNLVFTPDSLTPVWAERRLDSPLATVPGPVDVNGTLTDPISSATLRMRYRDDVVPGLTMQRAGETRLWNVGETLEIGRRKFLDVGLASYPTPLTIVPDPTGPDMPDPVVPDTYTPPTGWGFEVDGAPLRTLTLTNVQTGPGGRRSGTFQAVAGVTGTMSSALDIGQDRWMCGHVVRTGKGVYWSWGTASTAYTDEWDYSFVLASDTIGNYDFGSNVFPSASDTLTAGSHPLFIGDEFRVSHESRVGSVLQVMAFIRITVDGGDPSAIAQIIQDLVNAVKEELEVELHRLVRDGQRFWRAATPYVTGTLRRSELGIAIIDHKRGIYRTTFTVVPPGRGYYNDVAKLPKYRGRGTAKPGVGKQMAQPAHPGVR